jgi:hypothetical protein
MLISPIYADGGDKQRTTLEENRNLGSRFDAEVGWAPFKAGADRVQISGVARNCIPSLAALGQTEA